MSVLIRAFVVSVAVIGGVAAANPVRAEAPPIDPESEEPDTAEDPNDRVETDTLTAKPLLPTLDPWLVGIPFDESFDETVRWLSKRLKEWYDGQMRAAGDVQRKRDLHAQLHREALALRGAEVALVGTGTLFDETVVGREFVSDARESVVVYRQGLEKRYLFFTNGKLWKYVQTLPPEITWAEREKRYLERLGIPALIGVEKKAWKDQLHRAELRNAREAFKCDVLVVTYRPIAERIEEIRKLSREEAQRGLDPDVEEFLDPNDEEGYQPEAEP